MLCQFFHVAVNWFEKSATVTYPENRILTYYAEGLLENIIKDEFVVEKFDPNIHFKRNNIECGCFFGNDLGIPFPFTIRLLRKNKYSEKNEEENEELLKVSFIHDQNLIKMISSEWLISTQKEAFKPLIKQVEPLYEIISLKTDKDLNIVKNWIF